MDDGALVAVTSGTGCRSVRARRFANVVAATAPANAIAAVAMYASATPSTA